VIVDSTMQAAKALDETMERVEMRIKLDRLEELRDIVFQMDTDRSATVTIAEIEAGMNVPSIRESFDKLDLPPDFTAQDIFTLLDRDGDGEITTAEFMCSMFSLINNDEFQTRCNLHVMLNLINRNLQRCTHGLEYLAPEPEPKEANGNLSVPGEADQQKGQKEAPKQIAFATVPISRVERLEKLVLRSKLRTEEMFAKIDNRIASLEMSRSLARSSVAETNGASPSLDRGSGRVFWPCRMTTIHQDQLPREHLGRNT